ncbi:fucose permease [Deinobacterium chartae]|uniref:Fucose permease n=1 Tax=Deinobacterium chartae TaxID=521158 RepID=A0A841HXY8_9DEIO|nr:MFS transporter [Deinobacterium chartae]MBB6097070.1 fucose permease [Deinobacterium chartae]
MSSPRSRSVYVLGFSSFILIGAVQAMYGPSLPGFAERFFGDLEASAAAARVGLAVTLQFLGIMGGTLIGGALLSRLGGRTVVQGAMGLLALGMIGMGLSGQWWTLLAASLLGGIGYGGLSVGFNLMYSAFGERAAAALNLLNATFGIGSVLGPLLVGTLAVRSVGLPFLVLGGVAAVLVFALARLRLEAAPRQAAGPAAAVNLRWVAGFALLFFVYVGCETGPGNWESWHLSALWTPQGEAASAEVRARAAFLTSLYWMAITVGRFLAAPLSLRLPPHRLVLGSALFGCVGLALTHLSGIAPLGYVVAGLCFAPIFPTSLAWFGRVLPEGGRWGSVVIACGSMGGVVFPPLIGTLVRAEGPLVIPTVLTALALLLCLVVAALSWAGGRRTLPSSVA